MSDELDVVDALLELAAERDIARLGRDPATPAVAAAEDDRGAELRERLDDHLAAERLTAIHRAARESEGLSSAEPRRLALRALAPWYLELAAREPEAELAERRARHAIPDVGFEAAVACAASPGERDAAYERWVALERDLEDAYASRARAREEAARRAGATGVTELLGAAHAVPPQGLVEPFERAVLAPLDEAVARAADASWLRHGRGEGPRLAADAPRIQDLLDHGSWAGHERILAIVRWLAAGDGPEGGLEIVRARAVGVGATWRSTRAGHAWVGVGTCAGPAALRAALGALGAATRTAFVAATRGGARARFADPAFTVAADVLYGRLAACPRFREAAGLPENAAALRALGLHEAVATRVGWVYLQTVLANVDARDEAFGRSIERASGGPVTPAHRARVRDRDPSPAATLRGTVLGLLLEERLRSRFGRGWFAAPRARSWLRSVWEAEPDHTAETMAAAAGLGEIEPTPVLDASRAGLRE